MPSRRNEWVQLEHHQGHAVNTLGQVKNLATNEILAGTLNQTDVRYVSIRNTTEGKYENLTIGVLIASVFCERAQLGYDTVLHLDGNKDNNAAKNLMWVSRWHAIAYHKEIIQGHFRRGRRVQEKLTGRIYRNAHQAAMETGALPSMIDYAVRYNDNLSDTPGMNLVHHLEPGGYVFVSP